MNKAVEDYKTMLIQHLEGRFKLNNDDRHIIGLVLDNTFLEGKTVIYGDLMNQGHIETNIKEDK